MAEHRKILRLVRLRIQTKTHHADGTYSGDSYSTTTFNATGPQPNSSNPLGNPPYPGYTSSDGPNWVDYLTVKYNQSLIETVNLAYGGATVDSTLAKPYLPTVLSLQQQVQEEFLPLYTGPSPKVPWTPDTTLFALFFGINDIGNTYYLNSASDYISLYTAILTKYAEQVSTLYASGARHFLFLNVPPIQRSPLTTSQIPLASTAESYAISIFNVGLQDLVQELQQNASIAGDTTLTVTTFDTYSLFTAVLDDPGVSQITAGYRNTTGYCPAYEDGMPTMTYFNESCGIPVNEYFWLNTLHPTYPMHDLLAERIAMAL